MYRGYGTRVIHTTSKSSNQANTKATYLVGLIRSHEIGFFIKIMMRIDMTNNIVYVT